MRYLPSLPVLLLLFITGCATTLVALKLDDRFGMADPARFDHPRPEVKGAPDYWKDVRPVLDQRCVACHACYDAPCQLNLTRYEGITRGADPEPVYSSTRLLADPPTRLGFDALTNAAWRSKGFFPVLNEREQTPEANRVGGVMYRMLDLKQRHPGPTQGPITDTDLDFSLSRAQICVRAEAMDHYETWHPNRGMPFGLPALSTAEHKTLASWLEAGAPYTPPPPLSAEVLQQVADWERFLNGSSLKEQLVARYIYEHWYIGQFYFAESPEQFFELVRSRTAPGQPIDVVATRRPFDDPGVPRVYYRLRPLNATQVAKTYMPLQLDAARMARVRGWFFKPDYQVTALPGYARETASNPFISFSALPVDSRYRFMLDEAQFTMMGFMKGPVCRGQIALDVINDYFWVMFIDPDSMAAKEAEAYLAAEAPNLELPAGQKAIVGILPWLQYSKLESAQLAAKSALLAKLGKQHPPKMNDLWSGNGQNPNAGLTVFRHFDSASVMQRLAGPRPQTMLVLTYPLFERMHYLLLAGYDVYGTIGEQLDTRLYMDFLRMEGELNFLAFLPKAERQKVLDFWYRGRSKQHDRYLADANAYSPAESGVRYEKGEALGQLYTMAAQRVAAVASPALTWRGPLNLSPAEIAQMQRLSAVHGIPASIMPEQSLLLVRRPGKELKIVSLVRNSAHTNVAEMFDEAKRRLPKEDTLLALDGVVGSYPNMIFTLDASELPAFTAAVADLSDQAGLVKLVERFGVRRMDARFWPLSDALHAEWRRTHPRTAAILDYSRLEND